jgi:hypothetical protein
MTALPNQVPLRLTTAHDDAPDPSSHPDFGRVMALLLSDGETVAETAESCELGIREVLAIANSEKARAIIEGQIAFEARRAELFLAQARSAALRTLVALNTLTDSIHDRTDRALETLRKSVAAALKSQHAPPPPRGRGLGGGFLARPTTRGLRPNHAGNDNPGSAQHRTRPLAEENSPAPANNPLPATAAHSATELPGRMPHAMNICNTCNTLTTRRSASIPVLIALAGVLACSPAALAQSDLPAALVTTSSALTKDQETEVANFAKPHLEAFKGEDPDKVKSARIALSNPLTRRNPSLAFRQGYSKVLGPELAAVVDRKDALTAVSALRIAAELATQEGFDVLEKGYASADESIQIAAAGGAARAFEVIRSTPQAAAAGRLTKAVDELGKLFEKTPNADVADAAARALVTALRTSTNADVRSRASEVACRGLGNRAKAITTITPGDRTLLPLVRIAGEVRDDLTDNTRAPLNQAAQSARREVGGDCIALVARLVRLGQLPAVRREDDAAEKKNKELLRPLPTQLVGAGEQIISLVAGSADPVRTSLAEMIRKPDVSTDAQFLEGAKELLGPGKRMSRPPFSLPDARFDLGK